jgi:myo-inositol-1(or 4)-monophosphatase
VESPPLGAGHVPIPVAGRHRLRGDRLAGVRDQGDLLNDLELAVSLAHEAGALLLERVGRRARDVDVKTTATDMVSAADRDAEALIRSGLTRARPADGLVAEEGSRRESASGRQWIVDPLDGTTNFLYGFPQWAVSIALEGELGVVFDPERNELFAAQTGAGATVNGEPLVMRAPALIATGFGYDAERRRKQGQVVGRVVPRVRDIRRAGAAALDLCWLAAGRLDGYYERGLHAWDWAAARIVVEEAGGAVADLDPEPHGLAAAHPELLPELLELLRDAELGVF